MNMIKLRENIFRREFDEEAHPRQFIPPKVNFEVNL